MACADIDCDLHGLFRLGKFNRLEIKCILFHIITRFLFT